MKHRHAGQVVVAALAWGLLMGTVAYAADSPIDKMSQQQLIELAMSAAPPFISTNATILIPGADGAMVEARKGTNGFTCIPDMDGQAEPDPFCGDAASWRWANDFMAGAEKPSNTQPGIAYMAKGGWHWEMDGKILMKDEPGAKLVKEPPHWMLFWPVDARMSGLPSLPHKKFGTYVMFEGTPYAHLMIYQDPMQLK